MTFKFFKEIISHLDVLISGDIYEIIGSIKLQKHCYSVS